MKIGIVGDLSQGDPALLAKAFDAALAASDVVVQVGDVNPGYGVVRDRLASGKLFVIPGNHDTLGPGNWDAELPGQEKQWAKEFPGVYLIGLDNSKDDFDDEAYRLLAGIPRAFTGAVGVFFHKSLTRLVLPDGSESSHVMGEGGDIPSPAAEKMIAMLEERTSSYYDFIGCGHYHGQSIISTSYGTVILEGRGGAAGPSNVGYTLLIVTPDGWVAHPVTL